MRLPPRRPSLRVPSPDRENGDERPDRARRRAARRRLREPHGDRYRGAACRPNQGASARRLCRGRGSAASRRACRSPGRSRSAQGPSRFTTESIELHLRAQAERARQELFAAAQQHRVKCTFEIVRGASELRGFRRLGTRPGRRRRAEPPDRRALPGGTSLVVLDRGRGGAVPAGAARRGRAAGSVVSCCCATAALPRSGCSTLRPRWRRPRRRHADGHMPAGCCRRGGVRAMDHRSADRTFGAASGRGRAG